MNMRNVALIAGAIIAMLGAFRSEALSNVEVVRHWSLYAASNAVQPYRLFLDPFPDARTCEVERDKIVNAGGRAYCGSRLVLAFDRDRESRLFWEFFSPANPWSKLCGNRR
jgi:hypothetical protein